LRSWEANPANSLLLENCRLFVLLFEKYRAVWVVFSCYLKQIENQYSQAEKISPSLVHKIACAKIEVIAFCLRAIHELKERVGAWGVTEQGAFNSDIEAIYLARFAEGDSSILQQKMCRDQIKSLSNPLNLIKTFFGAFLSFSETGVVAFARFKYAFDKINLALKLNSTTGNTEKMVKTFLENHELVERISKRSALLTIHDSVKRELNGTAEFEYFLEYLRLECRS